MPGYLQVLVRVNYIISVYFNERGKSYLPLPPLLFTKILDRIKQG